MARQLVELRAAQRGLHMQRAVFICRQEGQVDAGNGDAGKLDLRLFRRLAHALHGRSILAQVDLMLLLEAVHQVIHDALVEIVAAEAVVARRRKHLDNIRIDVENGDVERAAAQIVDHDLLRLFLIYAVGQGGRSRLIDDALDIQSGDLARVLGSLPLRIGEIGRYGNHSLRYRFAEICLRIGLELLQDHRRDFLRRILLSINIDAIIAAHFALD